MSSFAQVGGHAQTIKLSISDTSIVNKPFSVTEHAFYTQVGPTLDKDWIGYWTPQYYGTLALQGSVDEQGNILSPAEGVAAVAESAQMMVLENLTYRFLRPNVLDVKLGTQLHEETAPPEKAQRMAATAAATTSGETGIRLTGFQVWDNQKQEYHVTPKSYGKSIKVKDLPSGIARFFYPSLAKDALEPATDGLPESLPAEIVKQTLTEMVVRIKALEKLLSRLELRMRGASLLVVVEGNLQALQGARVREAERSATKGNGSTSDDDVSDDSESTTDADGNSKEFSRISWDLKLIDFAHSRAAPGEGPDEGLILGISNFRKLIQDLVESLP